MIRAFVLLTLLVAGPARAEDVASVMVVTGEAFVVDGGTEHPATVGQALSRDDVVRTEFGGAVILHLHNNHLVRVDEDLELRVSDLVLLDAPPIALDAKAQLAQLVQPEERAAMQGLADAERVAGWHARLTAAYTPGAVDDEAPPAEAAPTVASRGPASAPSRARTAKKAAPAAPPPPPSLDESGAAEERELAAGSAPAGAAATGAAGGAPAATGAAATGIAQTRAQVETAFAKGAVHDAIVAWARGLPVPVESVAFDVRVKDGRIAKIVAHGGLLPPPEVRALVGTAVSDAAEAFTVTVAVK